MTKEELSQLQYLNREIELLQSRLLGLESTPKQMFGCVKGSATSPPYNLHSITVSGYDDDLAQEIGEVKAEIKSMLRRCLRERARLEQYIAAAPDSEMRMILGLRYINGLSWGQVAAHISSYATESSIKMAVQRFLAK